jgi:anti-anti-sigma factor
MRDVVSSALHALEERDWLSKDQQYFAHLCLEEAIVNAMKHGNKGNKTLRVNLEILDESENCRIIVRDQGDGFCPTSLEPPPTEELGGRGVFLIKSFMKQVTFNQATRGLEMVLPKRKTTEETKHMSEEAMVQFDYDEPITVATVKSATVLDAVNVTQFGQEVQAYLKKHNAIHLLLDFRNVEYLSSAVLTELLRIKKTVAEHKGTVRLCALTANIRKVFEITNLDKVFPIEPNRETAIPRYMRAVQVAQQEATWDGSSSSGS